MHRITALFFILIIGAGMVGATEQRHRLGGGAHYWRTIDRIKDDDYKLDDNGVAWLVSYQFAPAALVKFEADVEIFPSGFGGYDKTTFAPQAYLVVGSGLYVAGGIGINYADGKFADDPFYAIRAGLDLEVLPSLHLDINANYRFIDWQNIKELDKHINTDTITLGAALRLAF
ncbi:MAG: hypothetical protein ABR497_05300 [Kiritimatiellia bacterium]|nr:hypothetical protein [Lentisphaerota bacterium]